MCELCERSRPGLSPTRRALLKTGAGADVVHAGPGDDGIDGEGFDRSPKRLYGEAGKDIIFGGAGNDYLDGGAGDDELRGGPGNARDGILRSIRDEQARESIIVDFAPVPGSRIGELAARFDIVLGFTPEA